MADRKHFTEIYKGQFLQALVDRDVCGNIGKACAVVGFGYDTISRERKVDAVFDEQVEAAIDVGRKMLADEAENTLLTNLRKGKELTSFFVLKNLRKDIYKEGADSGTKIDNRRVMLIDNPKVMKTLLATAEAVVQKIPTINKAHDGKES